MASKYDGKFTVGQKFGRWTVIDPMVHFSGSLTHYEAYVDVQCECGTKKQVRAASLLKGKTLSCGCRRKIRGVGSPAWKGGSVVPKTALRSVSRSIMFGEASTTNALLANSASLNWPIQTGSLNPQVSLQFADTLYTSQHGKCALTGVPISFADSTARLARVNNALDYTSDNVQWVHRDVYKLQQQTPSNEAFLALCRQVTTFLHSRTDTHG